MGTYEFWIAIGINCNGTDQTITWLDSKVPYKSANSFIKKQQMYAYFLNFLSPDKESSNKDNNQHIANSILEAYFLVKAEVNEVAQKQTHWQC